MYRETTTSFANNRFDLEGLCFYFQDRMLSSDESNRLTKLTSYIHKYGGNTSLSINFKPPSSMAKSEKLANVIKADLETVLQIANEFLIWRDSIA